jgi:predicted transcriptional regulator of viral defense system
VNDYNQVRYWVEELPKMGKTTLSLKEAEDQFPEKPSSSVRRALARLSGTGKIHSVWRGFYAIALPEYGLDGIAPPIDYVDQLMRYLGKKYYVALLTAASYNGASHQAPQSFYVICDSILHTKNKNGVKRETRR